MVNEQVLSMRPVSLPLGPAPERARRVRALAVLAVAALLVHAALLGGLRWTWPDPAPRLPALEVRTLGAASAIDGLAAAPAAAPIPDAAAPTGAPDAPGASRPAAERPRATARKPQPPLRAAAPAQPNSPTAPTEPSAGGATSTAARASPTAPTGPERALPADESIPLYRTRIPPAATLHYAMRRGALRGTAELQWQPTAEGYALRLDASIAGATVLAQTSEGGFDAAGLAPLRYTDRRQRRQLLATNFQRAAGKISFSGSSNEFALRRGAQDRLTWMLQLAAVASAEPERLVQGGSIEMAVAGVRGDAAPWVFRCVGAEAVATDAGPIDAVKLVRDSTGPYDTAVEVWLDPQRDYFPLHVLLRSGSDAQTLEFVLQRLDVER